MRNILLALLMTLATQVGLLVPIKASARSHALQIFIQTCDYAKELVRTIMDKICSSRRLKYFMELDFGSRAIMKIVFDAYHTNQAEF